MAFEFGNDSGKRKKEGGIISRSERGQRHSVAEVIWGTDDGLIINGSSYTSHTQSLTFSLSQSRSDLFTL